LVWSQTVDKGVELGLRLASALGWFWFVRGHLTEGRSWLTKILERSQAIATLTRATALNAAGWLAHYQDDYVAAQALYEQGLALGRAFGDKRVSAAALRALALLMPQGPFVERAEALLDESLRLAREAGDPWLLAIVLQNVGWTASRRAANQRASAFLEDSLALSQELGDSWGSCWTLLFLGGIARAQCDYGRARALAEQSLVLFRELSDKVGSAHALWNLGHIARSLGEDAHAAAYYDAALALFREQGIAFGIASVRHNQAYLAQHQADYVRAAALLKESLGLARALASEDMIAWNLAGLGGVAAALGQSERAARLLGKATALFDTGRHNIDPTEQVEHDRYIATARSQLDEATFAAAWTAGQTMSVEQAIADALANDAPPASNTTATGQTNVELRIENVELRNESPQHSQFSILDSRFSTHRHNLPAALTPFVGREAELAELAELLRAPERRLLTIVGAGGMGKTRLAIELARGCLDAFADGVCFVALAPLAAADALPAAIAQALDLSLHGGDVAAALLRFLRDKQMLLVLDNCEHLLDGPSSPSTGSGTSSGQGVGLVVEILQAAPRVQILATSREQLHVRGEQLYVVQGLAYTLDAPLAEAATSPAMRLFVQCARRVRSSFSLNAANLADMVRICQLVQGMPLGLELAAAWAETLPLDLIAAEIAHSADFLATEWREVPERQRSMRAVFDWSWQLLGDAERQALCQLAVFRGGFTHDAAQAVVGVSPRVLTRLIHKSLLRWSETQGGIGRYEIHELLRQFAAEHLDADPDERAAVEQRHSVFYLQFVAARETRLARNEPREAAAEIRGEIDNIRQAWAWAVAHTQLNELDRAAGGLWQFYQLTGRSEGEYAFRLAVARIHEHGEAAIGDEQARQSDQRVVSKLLALHARTLIDLGAYQEAFSSAQQAVALAQTSGGVEGETIGYEVWAKALFWKGHYLQARDQMQHALQLALVYQRSHPTLESLGIIEWQAHIWLQGTNVKLGDYAAARSHSTRALQLCQRHGRRFGEVSCLGNRADIAREMHDLAAARKDYEQAVRLAPTVSFRWGEGINQLELGDTVRLQGEYALALDLTERALAIFREIGDGVEAVRAAAYLGRLYCYLGDYARAHDWFAEFSRGAATFESPERVIDGLIPRAVLALRLGDAEQAHAYAEQAWQLAHEVGSPYTQAHALVVLAHAQAAQGLPDAAASYQQALARYEALGNLPLTAEPRAGLASVALARGDRAGALAHVEALLDVLADNPCAGLDEPFDIYLTCYRILEAHHDPRATPVLQTAHRLLHEYADQITDGALRQSFLENVATHRDLAALGARISATDASSELRVMSSELSEPELRTQNSTLKTQNSHNLPSPLTSFIGRAEELAQLVALLDGDMRLLTLVGAGGAGKTRLALAAAEALRPQFADEVWWVALVGVQPADDEALQRTTLASVIATALGRTLSGRRPPLDELAEALHDCAALLVLDNCEHLPEVAAVARALLEAAPSLRVLATSREPLGLGGEALLRLSGLAVPEAGAADPALYPGVRLFLERAARHTPGWGQDAAEVAAVARLCRLLDGLPLGIELAAHWVGHYTPDEISAAIQTDLDFLAARTRDVEGRHRSLRAVFGYTWSLLSATEQQGVARLSVFRGTFDRAAAQAVAGVRATTLAALVDKSLVRQAGVGHYSLHELLRQFAAERLEESGDVAAIRAQHAAYYLALAEQAVPELAGPHQATALERLSRALDNLGAALTYCLEANDVRLGAGDLRHDDTSLKPQASSLTDDTSLKPQASSRTELGLRLGGALWPFWQRHCYLVEGRRWLEGFLAAPDVGAVAPEVRATALIGAGWLAHDQDEYVQADALFDEGLRLDRALGHTGRVAAVLAHRGIMARGQGQYAQATALIEESLALARAAEDHAGIAYALFRLGVVTRERGEYARATSIYQECLAAYRALGDRSRAASALLGLGDIARDQGDAAQLEAYCLESLAICRELGQHPSVGYSLNNLALAATLRGDLTRAAALAEEALALFRAHGIHGGVVELLITRGQIACAQGDYERAQAALAEGVAQGWPGDPHLLVASGLEELARVAVAQGDAAHATRLCGAAAAWRTEMGAPLQPYRRAAYEATLTAAQHALGADGFAMAWAEGTAWQPSQVVDAARAWTPVARLQRAASELQTTIPVP